MKKGILIISYTFPPKEGIGGRRWAKFAKHLAASGYDIHIIHQSSAENENSVWLNDVSNINIRTYTINPFYPKSFSFFSKSTLKSKLAFNFWKNGLKILYKGVIFDRTLFWRTSLHKKIKSILRNENIDYIIVTIPPFLLAKRVLELKHSFPNVKFVIDYRDPWTENKSFHGFKNIKKKTLEFEKKIENKAILSADLVLSTNQQMNLWNQLKNVDKNKFKVLENGFDEDEIQIYNLPKKGNKPTSLLLAGSIYDGLDYIFNPFIEVICSIEKIDPQFYKNFEFIFIGTLSDKLERQVKDKNIVSIKILPRLSRLELNTFYNKAEFFMMFSAIDHGFAFNTKFYEYLAYKKPIIHFGPEGDVTDFLRKNKIGLGISAKSLNKEFKNVLEQIKDNKLKFNKGFKIEQFEVKNLTKKLISLLEN